MTMCLFACSDARNVVGKPMEAMIESGEPHKDSNTLAYEHTVNLNAASGEISKVYSAITASCMKVMSPKCVVLESNIQSGNRVEAFLKIRAEPAELKKIMGDLKQFGDIHSQSSKAEDLAGPMADGKRTLAMKVEYRSRLEDLLKKATNDIESLIKLNKELAEVQSQIEAISGENAFMQKRVQTEILNLYIRPFISGSAWGSSTSLLSDINSSLASGSLSAITGLAFLLPWMLVISIFTYVIVIFRRRKQRKNST